MGWVLLMPAAERNLRHFAPGVSRCHGRQDLGAAIFAQAITGRGLAPQKEKNKNTYLLVVQLDFVSSGITCLFTAFPHYVLVHGHTVYSYAF